MCGGQLRDHQLVDGANARQRGTIGCSESGAASPPQCPGAGAAEQRCGDGCVVHAEADQFVAVADEHSREPYRFCWVVDLACHCEAHGRVVDRDGFGACAFGEAAQEHRLFDRGWTLFQLPKPTRTTDSHEASQGTSKT